MDFEVVPDIPQLLYRRRIPFCIDVPVVMYRLGVSRQVEIVKRTFIAAHVSLVEKIHSHDLALNGLSSSVFIYRIDDVVIMAA